MEAHGMMAKFEFWPGLKYNNALVQTGQAKLHNDATALWRFEVYRKY
uniref:Uncharacterized protein n=1 Tax=Nelumbo nucifera TaxID=4432 RepID=A0A822XQW4_NELNU|nr:TPA_asm: hypothetical protein HUJ06_023884 [Nelumbo nucifera]